MKPFLLDITSAASVANVGTMLADWVATGSAKTGPKNVLHALVNNAGIGEGGLVDWVDLDIFRKIIEVNFLGHVAMTKILLPQLMRAAKLAAHQLQAAPRIVFVTSVAGMLAPPGFSAYCASKYALEAFR